MIDASKFPEPDDLAALRELPGCMKQLSKSIDDFPENLARHIYAVEVSAVIGLLVGLVIGLAIGHRRRTSP